jgi:hypothetical protein
MPPQPEEFDSFIDAFMAFFNFFHAQPGYTQILIIALLVAVTVGSIVLAYYIVKVVILLIVELFKLLIRFLKLIFGKNSKKQPQAPAAQPAAAPVPARPQNVEQPMPQQTIRPQVVAPQAYKTTQIVPVAAQQPPISQNQMKLHCPMCGEKFTKEMIAVINGKGKAFCEYCGQELEFTVQ